MKVPHFNKAVRLTATQLLGTLGTNIGWGMRARLLLKQKLKERLTVVLSTVTPEGGAPNLTLLSREMLDWVLVEQEVMGQLK